MNCRLKRKISSTGSTKLPLKLCIFQIIPPPIEILKEMPLLGDFKAHRCPTAQAQVALILNISKLTLRRQGNSAKLYLLREIMGSLVLNSYFSILLDTKSLSE
jgi:hypothetical protein